MKCPKCQGEMEVGYKLYPAYGGPQIAQWTAEYNDKEKFKPRYNVHAVINIKTNRCKQCGYLESYAK